VVVNDRFPFTEKIIDGTMIRHFSSNVDEEELVWHRDREDRAVTVLSGEGWYFQMDGELPVEMKPGDVINIPRESWHRVIRRRQAGPLTVRVVCR
jgi:mannose-6-phosphate isomerase-like protein (cupin superfamily)